MCGKLHTGICFERVIQRGQLRTCTHLFHYRCILRWSKTANLCPICRLPFHRIEQVRGKRVVKEVEVETPCGAEEDQNGSEDSEEDWFNGCQICGEDSLSGLILCDGEDGECSNAYHLRCIGLAVPPRSPWLCAECKSLEEYRSEHPEQFSMEESEDSLWSEESEAESTDAPVRLAESSESEPEGDRGDYADRGSERVDTPEEPAVLLYRDRPGKRGRSEPDFKRFVTEFVRKELGTSPEGLTATIHHRQLLSK